MVFGPPTHPVSESLQNGAFEEAGGTAGAAQREGICGPVLGVEHRLDLPLGGPFIFNRETVIAVAFPEGGKTLNCSGS